MSGPLVRVCALVLIGLLAACGSQTARLSYTPERGSYPAPGSAADPWGPYIDEASRRFGVPSQWIRAVMHQETGGNEYLDGQPITSSAGAMGLMQLMPATYSDLQSQYGLGGDPYDPHDNIMAGTAYIRQMYDKYGSPGFLAAYNAGPARVDDYLAGQGGLPAETENYVASIAPHLGDVSTSPATVEVAEAAPVSRFEPPPGPVRSASAACWHDPDAAYDPTTPCVSPPVVESLPAQPMQAQTVATPFIQPVAYRPAVTAIGHFDAPLPPSGMAPPSRPTLPVIRTSYSHATMTRLSGVWAVQVGAFGRPEEAQLATAVAERAASSVLASSRAEVTTVGGLGGHPLYRARFAGLNRNTANEACGALRSQAIACMPVAPGS